MSLNNVFAYLSATVQMPIWNALKSHVIVSIFDKSNQVITVLV